MKRFLFIQFASVAELIVMTACFRSIKTTYPNCEIDLICNKNLNDFLQYIPDLNKIYFINSISEKEQVKLINDRDYDAYIDIQRRLFDESVAVTKWIKTANKIGYNLPGKKKPFTHFLDKTKKKYLVDHYLKCLPHLEVETIEKNYSLNLRGKVNEGEKAKVVIHLEKDVTNLDTITKLLTTQLVQILEFQIICHEEYREWTILSEMRIEFYADQTELIDLIRECNVFVSGQSYAVQLADYFRSPVVYLSDGTEYNQLLCSMQSESVILTARSKKDSIEQISLDAMIQGIRSVCGFI